MPSLIESHGIVMEIKYSGVHAWSLHYTLFVCPFSLEGINKVKYVCGRHFNMTLANPCLRVQVYS